MSAYASEYFTAAASSSASHETPEYTIPSSPILKDSDATPLYGSTTLHAPYNSNRTSRSSFRLSRDLASLRWNGHGLDESDLNEDDSMFGGDDAALEGSTMAEQSAPQNDPLGQAMRTNPEETGELNSYSALSKRADFILASAKRKLNLLEGDLKGARHSLLLPKVNSHSPTNSYSSSRLARPVPISTSEEDQANGGPRAPRVRSSLARDLRQFSSDDASRGHARVFSDTSVPSPRGATVKGSRSLEHVRNQHSLQKASSERILGPVIEDQVSSNYNDESTLEASRAAHTINNRASATQALRSEADDVRDRLALIQERLRLNAEKRRSSGDSAIISQIQELKISLGQQEEVIGQLERAEAPDMPAGYGPRAEWQQILDRSDNQADGYDSSDEYDEDAEFQSVLEQQEPDEGGPDLDGAHEDRADAFDYEHFILHSVLGNLAPETRSRSGSESSTSTARGLEDGVDDSRFYEPEPGASAHNHHYNESITSFATAQSFMGGSSSESDGPGVAQDEDEGEIDQWPMPPSTNGSRQASTIFSDSSDHTPIRGSFPSAYKTNGIGQHTGHRPASMIFSALMGPESTSSTLPTLDDDDQSLVYSLAEALRTACKQLRRDAMRDQGGVDWRERLEQARRALTGEGELLSS